MANAGLAFSAIEFITRPSAVISVCLSDETIQQQLNTNLIIINENLELFQFTVHHPLTEILINLFLTYQPATQNQSEA